MTDELECMCTECGISLYLSREIIVLEDYAHSGGVLLRTPFCVECGGHLQLIGKAGDEPIYRLQDGTGNDESQAK
jgi:hypothetical protein